MIQNKFSKIMFSFSAGNKYFERSKMFICILFPTIRKSSKKYVYRVVRNGWLYYFKFHIIGRTAFTERLAGIPELI